MRLLRAAAGLTLLLLGCALSLWVLTINFRIIDAWLGGLWAWAAVLFFPLLLVVAPVYAAIHHNWLPLVATLLSLLNVPLFWSGMALILSATVDEEEFVIPFEPNNGKQLRDIHTEDIEIMYDWAVRHSLYKDFQKAARLVLQRRKTP